MGHAAVDADGGLVGDVRAPQPHQRAEGGVQAAGPALDVARGQFDLDAAGAQPLDALSVGAGVGVDRRDHHAGDPGRDQGVGAGRRAAVVRARLEAGVGGGTGGVARRREGVHLGVRRSRALVPALADDGPVAHQHAPDHRVRRCGAGAQLGQLEAPLQVPEILRAHQTRLWPAARETSSR
jgi:hypothetical protein